MKLKRLSQTYYSNLILFLFLLPATITGIHENANIRQCGVSDSLKDISAFFSSLKTFFTSLQDIFSVLGASTIILFIAVVILSSGLSTLGIPRGKFSFISSLIIADILWIIWEKSFNAEFSSYALSIVKSNALLLLPLLTIAVIKKLKTVIRKAIQRKKPRGDAVFENTAIRQIEEAHYAFHVSLMKDLLDEAQASSLSEETQKAGQRLIESLKKII